MRDEARVKCDDERYVYRQPATAGRGSFELVSSSTQTACSKCDSIPT